jgi:hypothetical protein
LIKELAGATGGAARNAKLLVTLLNACRPRPVMVILGGAMRGLGSDRLWTDLQMS